MAVVGGATTAGIHRTDRRVRWGYPIWAVTSVCLLSPRLLGRGEQRGELIVGDECRSRITHIET